MAPDQKIWSQLLSRRDLIRYGLITGAGLTSLDLLAACGSGSPGSTNSGSTITMKLGSDSALADPHTQCVIQMKTEIEAKTNGRIKCIIYPNGTLGANDVMLNSIKQGTLDGMLCDLGVPTTAVPECNVMSLPFLFQDAKHALAAAQGAVGTVLKPKLEQAFNCNVLGWGSDGDVNMANKRHPIVSPADLKGLKMRTQQSSIQTDAYTAFGALPTPLSFTELYTSLQTGVVDGAGIAPSDMVGEKFYEVTKFYTLNGIFNNTQFVCVSKEFMSKLSSQDQDIVRQAGLDGGAANATATFNAQTTNVGSLTTDGMTVGQAMDRSDFLAIAKTVWSKDAAQVGGQALIDQAQSAG